MYSNLDYIIYNNIEACSVLIPSNTTSLMIIIITIYIPVCNMATWQYHGILTFLNAMYTCLYAPLCWEYGEKTHYSTYVLILYAYMYTFICYTTHMKYLKRTKGKFWGVGAINNSPHHQGVFLNYTDYG